MFIHTCLCRDASVRQIKQPKLYNTTNALFKCVQRQLPPRPNAPSNNCLRRPAPHPPTVRGVHTNAYSHADANTQTNTHVVANANTNTLAGAASPVALLDRCLNKR